LDGFCFIVRERNEPEALPEWFEELKRLVSTKKLEGNKIQDHRLLLDGADSGEAEVADARKRLAGMNNN